MRGEEEPNPKNEQSGGREGEGRVTPSSSIDVVFETDADESARSMTQRVELENER